MEGDSQSKGRVLPKYAYLRINRLAPFPQELIGECKEPVEVSKKLLKKDGYKVKRVAELDILQIKNKQYSTPISQHSLIK